MSYLNTSRKENSRVNIRENDGLSLGGRELELTIYDGLCILHVYKFFVICHYCFSISDITYHAERMTLVGSTLFPHTLYISLKKEFDSLF